MAAASPSRGRKRNITQYDFLDEPNPIVHDTAPPSPSSTSSFGLNFPIGSPGLRLSRDAGDLFHLYFKHNLKPEINFAYREFEKKRGDVPQKALENAFEVLQLAHKSHANSHQLFDRYGDTANSIAKNCCDIIKQQLSKHTNFQEDRIQAAAHREEGRKKDRVRYEEAHEEERQRADAEFCELVMTLDERYTSQLQYVPPNEEQREERKKQIRREVLQQQLAIVQKRRADRRAARKEQRERRTAAAAAAAPAAAAAAHTPATATSSSVDGSGLACDVRDAQESKQSEDKPAVVVPSEAKEKVEREEENEGREENGHDQHKDPEENSQEDEQGRAEEKPPPAALPPDDVALPGI